MSERERLREYDKPTLSYEAQAKRLMDRGLKADQADLFED